MAVEVKLSGLLQRLTGGSKTIRGEGETVAQVLEDLDARYSGLKSRLVAKDGKLRRFVNIYLNDEHILLGDGLETKVKDGDVVVILLPVAGGAS